MRPAAFNRILRAPDWLRGRLRVAILRMGGAHIGQHCFIRDIDVPCDPWDLWIDDGVGLDNHVVLCLNGPRRDGPKIVIRAGSYINRYTVIDAFQRIEIGRDCLIGPHCYIGDHARARVPGLPLGAGPLQGAPIMLGSGVYVGAGAVITGGITIGEAATIGAGAVVNRDVAPGDTVAGVPARSVADQKSKPIISFAAS
jgi:acetyltransferase-like isoleucine patch superfamily enzyme